MNALTCEVANSVGLGLKSIGTWAPEEAAPVKVKSAVKSFLTLQNGPSRRAVTVTGALPGKVMTNAPSGPVIAVDAPANTLSPASGANSGGFQAVSGNGPGL